MESVICPRAEYPRPELVRESWLCLNGEWDFEIDDGKNGKYKDYMDKTPLKDKILVPFSPESRLSGIEHIDFMNCVWYKRQVELPEEWAGRDILLHIGACDWRTTVYINGKTAACHIGGYTPIDVNITRFIKDKSFTLAVMAEDDTRSGYQMVGKQSYKKYESAGCYYTRTTGIWQTVWLEPVDKAHIITYNTNTDIDAPSASFSVTVSEEALGKSLSASVSYEGRIVGGGKCKIGGEVVTLNVSLAERHLWEVGRGRLYDVVFEISDDEGAVYDTADGYFGLRTVTMNKEGFFLNGEYVFGRFVLDQGFYPDGVYTAPTDEQLRLDIELSMELGFNGARLHQKVFEPRFLYYADKLGYMVWDETASWGWNHTDKASLYTFLPEWIEEMKRDMMHPSLIGWCPLNETWDKDGRRQDDEMLSIIYNVTRAIDSSRPIVLSSGTFPIYDISGNQLGCANDVHDYTQQPDKLAEVFADIDKGELYDQLYRNHNGKGRVRYDKSKSLFVSEYGGIGWIEGGQGWGYGKSVASKEEFITRLRDLTNVLLDMPECCALCYTQLYDVEQEKNGLLTYERADKFPREVIREIFSRKSVKEK